MKKLLLCVVLSLVIIATPVYVRFAKLHFTETPGERIIGRWYWGWNSRNALAFFANGRAEEYYPEYESITQFHYHFIDNSHIRFYDPQRSPAIVTCQLRFTDGNTMTLQGRWTGLEKFCRNPDDL